MLALLKIFYLSLGGYTMTFQFDDDYSSNKICKFFEIEKTVALNKLAENLRLGMDGKLFSVINGFSFSGECVRIAFHGDSKGDGEITIVIVENGKIVPAKSSRIKAKVVI